jgi:uncharacterized membrane protein YjfL (UPF0719 family)
MIKKSDIIMFGIIAALILSFLPFGFLQNFQDNFLFNKNLWHITSFLKFAVLATLGELIGLRIKTNSYIQKGFGIIPRAIVWGFLGIGIKIAFVIFTAGTPVVLENYFGLKNSISSMRQSDIFAAMDNGLGFSRFITAFAISTFMNLIFAPVFMTFHKITDTHIIDTNGSLRRFFTPIKYYEIFPKLNWFVQWDFVFKRTIPFFWIPAHTITFLMPEEYRIVFAALLGVVLGVLLAVASQKSK